MSLERELILGWKKQNLSDEDILAICRDYAEDPRARFPVTEDAIKAELNRYELMQRYKVSDISKRNSRRNERKRIREIIKARTQEQIEKYLAKNPDIVSIRINKDIKSAAKRVCPGCTEIWGSFFNKKETKTRCRSILIEKANNVTTEYEDAVLFHYCPKCGNIDPAHDYEHE